MTKHTDETLRNLRSQLALLFTLDPEAASHEAVLSQVFDDMVSAFRDAETHRHYGVEDEPQLSNAVDWLCAHALMMNSIINSLAQHLAKAADIPEELVVEMISEGSREKLLESIEQMQAALVVLRKDHADVDRRTGAVLTKFRTTAHDRD